MPRQTAYDQIERLVHRFKTLSTRARNAYNEDNTRKDFILPLFRALEWDTQDAREVAAEEKVSRGFVDFSFRLAGVPRFMLETKRIGENLDDPRWAQQAIDYAYHKDVTWAVLSDFEGLKVLNAEFKESNPLSATFKGFTFEDYLPRLDELWMLSRTSFAEGLLDREAEKVYKKSIKTPITQTLFDNLKDWRADLYKNLRAYNRDKLYTPKMIDDAVQRILDRLIFIRTAEDREVECENLLALVRELRDRNRMNDLIPALNRRFRELDGVYNSQLFAPHYSEDMTYEPTTLTNVIEGLYGSAANFVRYNFAFIDADVLGRAYEQYLGYVLSEREVIEAKQAKRKSQGIYYTPTFVVKYIVQQTLAKYLEEHGYNPSKPVRVLDPACGSGSFLIEAFDVLDQYLARQSNQGHGAHDVQDYARHMQILTQSLYGVDKDEQAVEVARLNLLLKGLYLREKLPTLENVRCGDSLISGTPEELEECFGKDWRAKRPFNWNDEFSKVMAEGGFDVIVGNPPYVRIQTLPKDEVAFFNRRYEAATGNYDIYVLFVERALQLLRPGGVFGMILPRKFFTSDYGEGLRELVSRGKTLCRLVDFGDAQVFREATTYTCLLFLQKQESPKVICTVAADWLRAQTQTPRALPNELQEFTIDSASFAATAWAFVSSNASSLHQRLGSLPLKLGGVARIFVGTQTSADDVFVLEDCQESKGKLQGYSRSLGHRVVVELESSVPFLRGREIRRYVPPQSRCRLVCPYEITENASRLFTPREMRQRLPLAYGYLKSNKQLLEEREQGKFSGDEWYAFGYPKSMTLFQKPKIIVPDYNNEASFTYDSTGHFYKTGYGVIPYGNVPSAQYILGLLNSTLLFKHLISIGTTLRGGYVRFWTKYIEQLPIRTLDFDNPAEKQQHDHIVALVDEMLLLQKEYAEIKDWGTQRCEEVKCQCQVKMSHF